MEQNKSSNPHTVITEEIRNSPLVWAAITEAVHRYYYDNVLARNRDEQAISLASDLLANLWCSYPNWREILIDKAARYKGANTTTIHLANKPKKEITVFLDVELGKPNRIVDDAVSDPSKAELEAKP